MNTEQQIEGAPPFWREGLIGKVIRYRWSPDVPWRVGQVLPDRDEEDSALNCCIRVADFHELTGDPIANKRCLRFAYPDRWMKGAQIEIVGDAAQTMSTS